MHDVRHNNDHKQATMKRTQRNHQRTASSILSIPRFVIWGKSLHFIFYMNDSQIFSSAPSLFYFYVHTPGLFLYCCSTRIATIEAALDSHIVDLKQRQPEAASSSIIVNGDINPPGRRAQQCMQGPIDKPKCPTKGTAALSPDGASVIFGVQSGHVPGIAGPGPSLTSMRIADLSFEWTFDSPDGQQSNYATTPPIVCGHMVLHTLYEGNNVLYSFNVSNGKVLWTFQVEDSPINTPVLCEPDPNTPVLCGPDGDIRFTSGAGKVYRLDCDGKGEGFSINGKGVGDWSGTSIAGPGPIDSRYFFGLGNDIYASYLYLYDPPIFPIWTFENFGGVSASNPVISSDGVMFYIGSRDHGVYAFETNADAGGGHSPYGANDWNFSTGGPVESSPILSADDNTLFIGSNDKYVYALFTRDGSVKWKFQTAGKVVATPLLSHDGQTLYVSSMDFNLYALKSEDGTKIWNYKTGGALTAAPILTQDGGTILIGSNDNFFYSISTCFGAPLGSYCKGDKIVPCPSGKYGAGGNADRCSNCPAGRFGIPQNGQPTMLTGCPNMCPAGSFGNVEGQQTEASACPGLCPSGTFGTVEGQTNVSAACGNLCPAGRFGSRQGQSTISNGCPGLCRAGSYGTMEGKTTDADACNKLCPMGKFGELAGQSNQSFACPGSCPMGKKGKKEGQTSETLACSGAWWTTVLTITGYATGAASGIGLGYKIFLFLHLKRKGRIKYATDSCCPNLRAFAAVLSSGDVGEHIHDADDDNNEYHIID